MTIKEAMLDGRRVYIVSREVWELMAGSIRDGFVALFSYPENIPIIWKDGE